MIALTYPTLNPIGGGVGFFGLCSVFAVMAGDLLFYTIDFGAPGFTNYGAAVNVGGFQGQFAFQSAAGNQPVDGQAVTLTLTWRRASFALVEAAVMPGPYTWSNTVGLGPTIAALTPGLTPAQQTELDSILAAVRRVFP